MLLRELYIYKLKLNNIYISLPTLATALRGRVYHYTHFIGDKTEDEGFALAQDHTASK